VLLVLGVISSKMSLRNWSGVPLVIVVIIDCFVSLGRCLNINIYASMQLLIIPRTSSSRRK
jgi:hypothetical protein